MAGGGFEQCYTAQAVVDAESMIILATHVTQVHDDKEQVEPMLEKSKRLPGDLKFDGLLVERRPNKT